jgi:hypothetical protein
MTPLLRVSSLAGVLLLGGCASWAPNWNFLSGSANVSLTIESDPPGADAKLSIGPSCRTPCMIPVPADRPFTVNYSLNGYLPQVVQVGPRGGADASLDVAGGASESMGGSMTAELAPNPVYAQLQPAPPPAPPPRRGSRPRPPKQPPLR